MNPAGPPLRPDADQRPDDRTGLVARPGVSTFTIEGRAAPGLFVAGWLATVTGLGSILTSVLAGNPDAKRILLLIGLVLIAVGLIAGAGSQAIERRARGRLPYQGPSPFLVLAASVPVAILALYLISLPLEWAGLRLEGAPGALVSVSVQAIVYVGLVRLLVVDIGALDWASMGLGRLDLSRVAAMAGGALWALPIVLVTGLLANVLVSIFPVQPDSPLPPTGTDTGLALSLLAGAVIAPFGEEILFRGFATTAWVRGLGVRRGVATGAIVFAFAHIISIAGATAGQALELAFVAFVVRLPVAFALGWIFVRRGTIWASFGLHAAYNAFLIILAEAALRST